MAVIQTYALITVMMGFLASTTFNQEFFRHRMIIIHCVLILLLLELRRLLQRENRGNQRRFWVIPIFTAKKTYGCHHTYVQELRLGDREWYLKFIRMSPERFEHLLSLVAPRISKQKNEASRAYWTGRAPLCNSTIPCFGRYSANTVVSFSRWQGNHIENNCRNLHCNMALLKLKEDCLKPPRTREQ